MHELSIADAIVTIASRHARGRQVTRVEVKVGHLRQVVPDSLQFAFELITTGTELEGAKLAVQEVPARVRCKACGTETELKEFPAHCGACGVEVTAGEELLVDSIDIENDRCLAAARPARQGLAGGKAA
jgi:hydrogenase nickel incorporation protein HypA/HybF